MSLKNSHRAYYSKTALVYVTERQPSDMPCQNGPSVCHSKTPIRHAMPKWPYCLSCQNSPGVYYAKMVLVFVMQSGPAVCHAKMALVSNQIKSNQILFKVGNVHLKKRKLARSYLPDYIM